MGGSSSNPHTMLLDLMNTRLTALENKLERIQENLEKRQDVQNDKLGDRIAKNETSITRLSAFGLVLIFIVANLDKILVLIKKAL